MRSRGTLTRALIAAAVVSGLASSAGAVTISGISAVANGVQTVLTGNSDNRNAVSGIANVGTDTATEFERRYWTAGVADTQQNDPAATATTNANWTITFSVTETNGSPYEVIVSTALLGALSSRDDVLLGQGLPGSMSISNVTGSKSGAGGAPVGSLGLASAASTTAGTANDTGVNLAVINATGGASIFATGTGAAQVFSLTFSFTATAAARATTLIQNGDEQGFRFGRATATASGLLSGAIAGDYPGTPSRNGTSDGHFVNVSVVPVAVPEPGTALLIGTGLSGLAIAGRRRTA